jgi:hypothetical protein
MTATERRRRRFRHVIVDVLDIAGGGLLADAISRRVWITGLVSVAVIALALWLDRRNALTE